MTVHQCHPQELQKKILVVGLAPFPLNHNFGVSSRAWDPWGPRGRFQIKETKSAVVGERELGLSESRPVWSENRS